jgi:hypothetical protein
MTHFMKTRGGRGKKGEASVISQQTGVPKSTVTPGERLSLTDIKSFEAMVC